MAACMSQCLCCGWYSMCMSAPWSQASPCSGWRRWWSSHSSIPLNQYRRDWISDSGGRLFRSASIRASDSWRIAAKASVCQKLSYSSSEGYTAGFRSQHRPTPIWPLFPRSWPPGTGLQCIAAHRATCPFQLRFFPVRAFHTRSSGSSIFPQIQWPFTESSAFPISGHLFLFAFPRWSACIYWRPPVMSEVSGSQLLKGLSDSRAQWFSSSAGCRNFAARWSWARSFGWSVESWHRLAAWFCPARRSI